MSKPKIYKQAAVEGIVTIVYIAAEWCLNVSHISVVVIKTIRMYSYWQ